MTKKEDEVGRACSIPGRDEKCTQKFSWRIWRKKPPGRPMCIWNDNIKMDLKQECEVVEWIHLVLDRVQ